MAALLATHTWSVAAIAAVLLVAALRAPARRRWPYLIGTLTTGLSVFVLTPFVEVIGTHELWVGPTIPVLGRLDVTTEELSNGLFQGLRLFAVGLAFAVYALLLDHDRLLAAAGWARRSTLAVALATRPVISLIIAAPDSSATRATFASRSAAAVSSSGPCGSSRRSWPVRSSGASTSPKRWRLAATVARAARALRARRGRVSTGSPSWDRSS